MTEYEKWLVEEEKRRRERERRWEKIEQEMEREYMRALDAIAMAKSISHVISIINDAKHKFIRYVSVVRRELPEFTEDATEVVLEMFKPRIISEGEKRVVEIYHKLVGE
jgi:hypothetical protein